MTIIPLEIGTQSNYGRYGQDGAARVINGHAEELGKEGKHPYPIYGSAGLQDFATLTDGGAVRDMIELNGHLHTVAGRAIYRVDEAGSGGAEPIGGMPSDGLVTMAFNRANEITVVCDGIAKVITGATVTDITNTNLEPSSSVSSLGGYSIHTQRRGRFQWSGIDNAHAFDALDFATAESQPDEIVIGKVLGRQFLPFGTKTIEFWNLTPEGNAAFTWQHTIDVGCWAAGSVCEIPVLTKEAATNSIAFAATNRQGGYAAVCLVENGAARVISKHDVDRAIEAEPDKNSITSCAWSEGGNSFYCISGSTFSWQWNSRTGQWNERQSYGLNRWKIRSTQHFGSGLIAGDYTSNKLYRMSRNYFDEAGDPLIMTIQTPPVHSFPEGLEFLALYLDVIPGVGIISGAPEVVNPQIMVSWADDGINFTAPRLLDLGRAGATVKRVLTTRLGQSKPGDAGRTFRFSVSVAAAKGLMGASLDVNKIAA
jgi:hypothetical protein